ncbi:MAG: type II toxin-antitoxin system Phd/YefM family antitoxin [Sulfurimonas sp.]|nr:type II toxin-antitoxin system Phd/YefM family antitoxin [Sulfurimonas sp.]
MVTYTTNELIPSSEFAKKFGSYLSQIKNSTMKKFAILKNNKVEAVLVSKDEYERMSEALKLLEYQEDKTYFNDAFDEIQKGKTKLLTQEEYNQKMNEFMKTL